MNIDMNKMYLVLGDWSSDGHGKSDKIILESDVSVEEIQRLYKNSCKLTGVSFNHNEDYTESHRDWKEVEDYQICVEYDNTSIPTKALEELRKFGLTDELLKSFKVEIDEDDDDKSVYLNTESFVNLWIWFVQLSNSTIKLVKENKKDKIPCINGYWNKNLNVQFGYGLYD